MWLALFELHAPEAIYATGYSGITEGVAVKSYHCISYVSVASCCTLLPGILRVSYAEHELVFASLDHTVAAATL